LCQTEYVFNFILLMYFKHNGMSSTKIHSADSYEKKSLYDTAVYTVTVLPSLAVTRLWNVELGPHCLRRTGIADRRLPRHTAATHF
jgi:hypothetical protein